MIRAILSVGGWTLVSRVTGFARDVAMAAIMGAGPIADAFVVAFRLPNHFRAIFGEGAFNTAFVPAYAGLEEAGDAGEARRFADRVFTLMLIVQLVLLNLALPLMPWVVHALAPGFSEDGERFRLAVILTRITFPYLLFMTLVTLLSGILNAHRRFAVAAGAPVLLNLAMLAALALAVLFPNAAYAAAWGVAVSGVLQFGLLWWGCRRAGVMPDLAVPRLDPALRRFFRVLGPAVIGAAGFQIAAFADTIIASWLPAGAVSALYYADRLYQLPFGVIAIAAGTVLLPEMSRRIASGDVAGAHAAQNRAAGFSGGLRAGAARRGAGAQRGGELLRPPGHHDAALGLALGHRRQRRPEALAHRPLRRHRLGARHGGQPVGQPRRAGRPGPPPRLDGAGPDAGPHRARRRPRLRGARGRGALRAAARRGRGAGPPARPRGRGAGAAGPRRGRGLRRRARRPAAPVRPAPAQGVSAVPSRRTDFAGGSDEDAPRAMTGNADRPAGVKDTVEVESRQGGSNSLSEPV